MAFVTRKAPALLLAAVTALGLMAPHAAEARDGRNAALIVGALLGAAAGAALTHSAQADDGYTVVEPAPRPVYRPRVVEPIYDEAGFDEPYRRRYRDDSPRYRYASDGWDRGGYRAERDLGRPCPDRDWRRYGGDGW